LNRSVMVVFIRAFTCVRLRVSAARRFPTQRAGNKKIGRSASATNEISHDKMNIAVSVAATPIALPTTDESVSVNACVRRAHRC